ncbi:type I restriction enzyme HsdR N-terminal domain-containing protein [Campylobacter sp. W0014]|uniref:N-6 DNA methylase n=1 Tax=Campylobacter sp. W0014 TaxID=2735781 RepID=UPI001EC2DA00|nr:type I restriction enzyme HsdR N-terminal domain-containing protein [Campylobacter sp. W0014]
MIEEILKDTGYKLDLFSKEAIEKLEKSIFTKEAKNGKNYYVQCLIRNKDIKLTPEEIVRQLYIDKLLNEYDYPKDRIKVEFGVHFGREVKRADIVVMDKIQITTPYIIVEVKKPKLKDGKEQLKSYCNATGATMAVWCNGKEISYYHRKDPNYFESIPNIPKSNQTLPEILRVDFTFKDLIEKDILKQQTRSLKSLILEMEDEVLANAGVDVFEECFKLIFIKLYDELEGARDKTKNLEFRKYGESDSELKQKIEILFDKAKKKWQGIFNTDEKIKLSPSHLSVCISLLQDVKLFNSNLEVIDDAFEYLVNKSSKGEKGQYFTPRYVIDMCVKMLNPKKDESMIDTASGSCGFPIHTCFYVWRSIYKERGIEASHLFTAEEKIPECQDYVKEKVFGIDFDEKSVRVSKMLNLIAGDGHTNVLYLNSIDFERWNEWVKEDEDWLSVYFEGFNRLKNLRATKNQNRDFDFDILMANPPFAGDIKESRILARYELCKKENGKIQTKMGRDILFIERNLDMLKPGGRMAIVLPQGRFNNSSDKFIREFIAQKARILAVIGLHGNVFKPHTGTKTSVLILQKWDEKLCPKVEDYNIFFATMNEPSKDNSGEKIYYPLLDSHDHLVVKHDLFYPHLEGDEPIKQKNESEEEFDKRIQKYKDNLEKYKDLQKDGIAEAFIEFAKSENLSFWR